MNPLVLDGFGSRLSVSHFRLVVNGEEYEARQFPYDSVYCLTLAGIVSFEALRWLSSQRIPVHFIDWHGKLQTSIVPAASPKGNPRVKQWEAQADPTVREEIGQRIIREKIEGQERTLREIRKPMNLDRSDEAHSARNYWTKMGLRFEEMGLSLRWSQEHPAASFCVSESKT